MTSDGRSMQADSKVINPTSPAYSDAGQDSRDYPGQPSGNAPVHRGHLWSSGCRVSR